MEQQITLHKDSDHRVCPVWVAYTFDNPLRRLFFNPEKLFGKYVRPGMKALDLGCGLGYNSLALARMVGANGKVFAVDLQEGMLCRLRKRAQRKKLVHRIETLRCEADSIGQFEPVDFAVAFWMLHETPDPRSTLRQLSDRLNPGGCIYLAEPGMHVDEVEFDRTVAYAEEIGFKVIDRPRIPMSRVAVLSRIL